MTSTGGSGLGQMAGELMQEMQKAQLDLQKTEGAGQAKGPNAAFLEAMQAQQDVSNIQGVQPAQAAPATTVIQQVQQTHEPTATNSAVGSTQKAENSKLAQIIEHLSEGQDEMHHIMQEAMSGKQFSPSELIALQAKVYQFSQEIDLTSKVIEKATGDIKQTLNTQVG